MSIVPQTLKEFMNNPMGKGSSVIINKQLIIDDLDRRYKELIKKHKDLDYSIYKDKNDYYFHFKIPSESERANTYDIVIQFTELTENFKYDNFLHRYYIKFFSNCPSFTYTYAYVCNKNKILVKFLKNKYSSDILLHEPKVRNPGGVMGYEKSIYFACKYLDSNRNLLNKMNINTKAIPLNIPQMSSVIRDMHKVDTEIKKENVRLSNEKKDARVLNTSNRNKTIGTKSPKHRKLQSFNTVKPKSKIKPKRKM